MKKILLIILTSLSFNAVASPLLVPLVLLGGAAVAYSVEELSEKGIGASIDSLKLSFSSALSFMLPFGTNLTQEEKTAGWTQKSDGTLQPPSSAQPFKVYSSSTAGYIALNQAYSLTEPPVPDGYTRTETQAYDSTVKRAYTIVELTKTGASTIKRGIYDKCPTAYNLTSSGCTLDATKASSVTLPNDKICKIVRVGSSFSFDTKDPDCQSDGLANSGIVLNGKTISQAKDGRYISVTSAADGTYIIQDKERKMAGSVVYTQTDTAVISPSNASNPASSLSYFVSKTEKYSESGDKTAALTDPILNGQTSTGTSNITVDTSKLEALVDPISKEFSKPIEHTNDLPDTSKFSDSWFDKITFRQEAGECKPVIVHFALQDNEVDACRFFDMIKNALTFLMYVFGPFALWRVARGKGE